MVFLLHWSSDGLLFLCLGRLPTTIWKGACRVEVGILALKSFRRLACNYVTCFGDDTYATYMHRHFPTLPPFFEHCCPWTDYAYPQPDNNPLKRHSQEIFTSLAMPIEYQEALHFIDDRPLYKVEKPFMCTIPIRHIPNVQPTNVQTSLHDVTMKNIRECDENFSLDVHGFRVENWPTEMSPSVFSDNSAIEKLYYRECEEFLKSLDIKRVFIFDHVVSFLALYVKHHSHLNQIDPKGRNKVQTCWCERVSKEPSSGSRSTCRRVVLQWNSTYLNRVLTTLTDQTPASAIRRVAHHLGDEAEELLKGRVRIINIWRPLFSHLKDHPLALCDYRSTTPDDFVATDLLSPHYEGEMFYVKHNVNHRWWFLDSMNMDEVLLIKCSDSDSDGLNIARCKQPCFQTPATK
jgi:hypothetical protein